MNILENINLLIEEMGGEKPPSIMNNIIGGFVGGTALGSGIGYLVNPGSSGPELAAYAFGHLGGLLGIIAGSILGPIRKQKAMFGDTLKEIRQIIELISSCQKIIGKNVDVSKNSKINEYVNYRCTVDDNGDDQDIKDYRLCIIKHIEQAIKEIENFKRNPEIKDNLIKIQKLLPIIKKGLLHNN